MDLVTLVTACALSLEPKVMQALILEQSSGQPWSFSVPDESSPRVLSTIHDAVREARAVHTNGGQINVGLTGLPTDPRGVTTGIFVPCLNITLAAEQISRLLERCKAASKSDPAYCAIAAYHGSWDRPHFWFADAVRSAVEKGDAPNVELPQDAYFDADDVASEIPTDRLTRAPDDHAIGWSSGLFPAKSTTKSSTSRVLLGSDPVVGPTAIRWCCKHSTRIKQDIDRQLVCRQIAPAERAMISSIALRGTAHVLARLATNQGWGGELTSAQLGGQDKSRKVRRGRLAAEDRCIRHVERGAPVASSLLIGTTTCNFTITRTSWALAS